AGGLGGDGEAVAGARGGEGEAVGAHRGDGPGRVGRRARDGAGPVAAPAEAGAGGVGALQEVGAAVGPQPPLLAVLVAAGSVLLDRAAAVGRVEAGDRALHEIGRASCRGRVEIAVVAG